MTMENRISLHKLEVFCRVVELGTMSRAGAELYLTQPVVTEHVRSLQARLSPDVDLLVRDGRVMRATEAGQLVYEWARELLDRRAELDRALSGLASGARGAAVVGATQAVGTYLIAPVVTRFGADHREVDLTLRILDADRALGAVQGGDCDLAVIIAEGDPRIGGLQFEHLLEEDLVLVGPTSGPLARTRLDVAELATVPFVCSPRDLPRRRIVDRQLRALGVESRNIVIELGHPEPMKQAVAVGLGVTVLFRSSVAAELAAGELREIELHGARLAMPVWLVTRTGKRLSPAQSALVEAIRTALADTGERPHGEGKSLGDYPEKAMG